MNPNSASRASHPTFVQGELISFEIPGWVAGSIRPCSEIQGIPTIYYKTTQQTILVVVINVSIDRKWKSYHITAKVRWQYIVSIYQ